MNSINNFIQAIAKFEQNFKQIDANQSELMAMRDDFVKNVQNIQFEDKNLSNKNPLSASVEQFSKQLAQAPSAWINQWDSTAVMREASDKFQDKIVLLVFGKVNSGKSSFCNFIASLFQGARYFHLSKGEIVYIEGPFKEGATETTSNIQGVELGDNLVLLDTPGLHSVTSENHQLTERFTDSADAVLWLTPSASPGQLHELESLEAELSKNKPLLPIISRSDTRVEDENEAGEIVSCLINKTLAARKGQEDDVYNRCKDKVGEKVEVKKPLSISLHAYQTSTKDSEDLNESGLSFLFESLQQLANEANSYKPKKTRQQIVNYLDTTVQKSITTQLQPAITAVKNCALAESENLLKDISAFEKELLIELSEKVVDWAETLKQSKDKKAFQDNIQNHVANRVNEKIELSVARFLQSSSIKASDLSLETILDFEDMSVEFKRISGSAAKAGAAAAGALAGAAGGSFIPVIGTAAGAILGSLLGGYLGDKAGEFFIEEHTVIESVGVDANNLIASTLKILDAEVPKYVEQAFSLWLSSLENICNNCEAIEQEMQNFQQQLEDAKQEIKACI